MPSVPVYAIRSESVNTALSATDSPVAYTDVTGVCVESQGTYR